MNLEEKIVSFEDGFCCDFYYKDERVRIKTKKSKSELLKKIKSKITKIEMAIKNPELKKEKVVVPTFEEAFFESVKLLNWQNSTLERNTKIFNIYFKEFAKKKLDTLKKDALLEWCSKICLLSANKKIRPNRVNKILRIMRRIIEYGDYKGFFTERIHPQDILYIKDTKQYSEKLENNYIIKEEFDIFIAEVMKLDKSLFRTIEQDFFCYMCSFLYYTGVRINEARGVKVSDFKIDRRNSGNVYVLIERQFEDNKNVVKARLKNDNPARKVYIKPEIYAYFLEIINKYELKKDDYIFDYRKIGNPVTRKVFSEMLLRMIRILKKDNLLPDSFPDILTPHGFRYSNTLYFKSLGLSVENIAKMQGHTVSVMLDVYTRSDKNEIASIFSK